MIGEFLRSLSNGDWLAHVVMWMVIGELALVAILLATARKG